MAIGNRYDTKQFLTGASRVEGFDAEYVDAGPAPAPIFNAMVTTIPYDIGEQSIANYIIARDQGKPLMGIPVFPSRFSPHFGIMVRQDSAIRTPADLIGKRVGMLNGWAFNPGIMLRGMFAHQYDVSPERIVWVEGPSNSMAGIDVPRSKRYTFEKVSIGLQEALEGGQIDALIMAGGGEPSRAGAYAAPSKTRKLFDDPLKEFENYVKQTSVFPLNTVLTIKQQAVKQYPGLIDAVMDACAEARRRYHEELRRDGGDHMGIQTSELARIGVFPDSYGLEANRAAIRMIIHYCYEQGLIRRLYAPEELFLDSNA